MRSRDSDFLLPQECRLFCMIELEIILLYTAHKVRNTISLKRMKKKYLKVAVELNLER
jgi:hypothetical protein